MGERKEKKYDILFNLIDHSPAILSDVDRSTLDKRFARAGAAASYRATHSHITVCEDATTIRRTRIEIARSAAL